MISYKIRQFKYIFLLGIVVFLFFAFILMIASKKPVILDDVKEIKFSAESGFYDSEFYLEIYAFGGDIYYTLDGSIPTCDSISYEGPIHISDASNNENTYSMRSDMWSDYLNANYELPSNKIDKCTIVRAVIYYGNGKYSGVKSASYFVGYNNKTGYDGMNIISLITDPDNLFDYNDGIYVKGEVYDSLEDYSDLLWQGNYSRRGISSEITASCQFFDSEKNLQLSQICGIRIHGGYSRNGIPKSLNLYARQEYNGRDYFTIDFFGDNYFESEVTLFQGGQDESKIMDYLMSKVMDNSNVSTMTFVPYILFLDGEYWGVYWMTEKYTADYIQKHYDVSPENVVIIKSNCLEEGVEDDLKKYNEDMWFCQTSDMTNSMNYNLACNMIDIDSYIDQYASLIYIARCVDWPITNEAVWKSRVIGNNKYEDGRWRWMMYDINTCSMSEELICHDTIKSTMEASPVFKNLMSNEEFKAIFFSRLQELSETTFDYDNIKKEIISFKLLFDEPMKKNMERFFGDNSYQMYIDKIDSILYFFANRKEYIDYLIDIYN